MDADHFDTLARSLSVPRSRRAALRGTAAGGLLSALGLGRAVPETRAAQGGTCVLAFAATAGRAGEVRGDLSFSLSASGNLDNATLALPDGTQLAVVGQATGHSLQLRIALGPQRALVAVGVGEQEIARCLGAIDGVVSGPQSGDLGDWHATAGVQNIPSGGQGSAAAQGTAASAGAGSGRSGRSGRNDRGATAAADSAGAAGQGPAAGTGQGASCPSGETYCAYVEECRNLRTSPLDCGACGTRCPSLVCQDGRCLSEDEADGLGGALTVECTEGLLLCNGTCIDPLTDPANCLQCGVTCTPPLMCIGGGCYCPGNAINCGEDAFNTPNCIDPLTDPNHCGLCTTVCAAGEICQQGACAASTTNAPALVCDAGLTDCGGGCVDLQTNGFHCGGCMLGCAGDQTCRDGACVSCPEGQTPCGAACVDTRTDLNNCGVCGNICGTQCIDGQCTGVGPAPAQVPCPAGQTLCGAACVDLSSDLNNCGSCGFRCIGKDPICDGGLCYSAGICPDDPERAC